MSALYVGIGDDPVGRPSTNGRFAVGLNSLMLHREHGQRHPSASRRDAPLAQVDRNVLPNLAGSVANDETCVALSVMFGEAQDTKRTHDVGAAAVTVASPMRGREGKRRRTDDASKEEAGY